MPSMIPQGKQYYETSAGVPLVGGKLYTYDAGTTNPRVTYQDAAGTQPNTNPIILDSRGEAIVYWSGSYKVSLKDSLDVLIWTVDNINNPLSNVDSSIIPALDITYDLGSSSKSWRQIYVGASHAAIADAVGNVGYWKQTAAELAAGVTPSSFFYPPGDVRRYGAVGDGTTDDSAAFAAAALVSATHAMLIYSATFKINTPVVLPSGAQVIGFSRPLLKSTVAGSHIFQSNLAAGIQIRGVRFLGLNSSTVPTTSVGGFAASSTGLVTITNSSDVYVEDCDFSTFYSGLSVIKCSRVHIFKNSITHWLVYGVLASLCSDFDIDFNDIITCDQSTGANAYGVSATGDENGGTIQKACSISFNTIRGIPSWDGIMTHDCDGMRVIGNDIRDVRMGVDIGHVNANNFVRNVTIANNYIESTATNTWGATPASHGGIIISGFDATHLVQNLTISGNTIRNFFTTAGMVGSGNPSPLTVSYSSRTTVTGNIIVGVGTITSPPGMFIVGNNDGIVVSGNTLQGSMPSGGIRFASVISDSAVVTGNTIKQTTTTDPAVQVSGSTITAWSCDDNAHNSTVPFVQSTSAITWANSGTVTLTLTGCTTAPTGVAQWVINGNMVMLTIPSVAGVSNTTACTLTGLPTYLQPFSGSVSQGINAQDNSAFGNNFTANITAGSGTITFQKNGSTTGFTAALNKGPFGSTIVYALN